MITITVFALLVVAIVVIAGGGFVLMERRRLLDSQAIQSRYGAEFDRAVSETGGAREAEAELRAREKRVRSFDIRPLTPRQAEHFIARWRHIQGDFVDDPSESIARADDLLAEVTRARGYPATDFEQRADDLSVDHAHLVKSYRMAHHIAGLDVWGSATTEDLRRAMVCYREIFEDMLETDPVHRRPDEPRSFSRADADLDLTEEADVRTPRRPEERREPFA
jgi:hypothetical protein